MGGVVEVGAVAASQLVKEEHKFIFVPVMDAEEKIVSPIQGCCRRIRGRRVGDLQA